MISSTPFVLSDFLLAVAFSDRVYDEAKRWESRLSSYLKEVGDTVSSEVPLTMSTYNEMSTSQSFYRLLYPQSSGPYHQEWGLLVWP